MQLIGFSRSVIQADAVTRMHLARWNRAKTQASILADLSIGSSICSQRVKYLNLPRYRDCAPNRRKSTALWEASLFFHSRLFENPNVSIMTAMARRRRRHIFFLSDQKRRAEIKKVPCAFVHLDGPCGRHRVIPFNMQDGCLRYPEIYISLPL